MLKEPIRVTYNCYLTRADFCLRFLVDIQICVLVSSKIKPSCTDHSVTCTSALK